MCKVSTTLLTLALVVCVLCKKVAILGGGVGGLSAALELAERGYHVQVYDRQEVFGGKARSIQYKGTGTSGRQDLPGEHGFRFFPGFYAHLDDTMKRVPYSTNKTTFDNLINADFEMLARDGKEPWIFPTHRPHSTWDLLKDLYLILNIRTLEIPPLELLYFSQRVAVMVMSCPLRWEGQYDQFSYWNFTNANKLSPQYGNYLVKGITRNIVAAKAEVASLMAIGRTFLALLESAISNDLDRLLNGPTNEKWLTPMVNYLAQRYNVTFFPSHTLLSFALNDNEIDHAVVRDNKGSIKKVIADHYISAVPAERMATIVNQELANKAPSLSHLGKLRVDWMNGIQFYFNRNISIIRGHIGYFESPWALTSISQQQFWSDVIVSKMGDGTAIDILSVDVSCWTCPGLPDGPAKGKTAANCSKDEIIAETWYQLHRHLPKYIPRNMSEVVKYVFFDPDIQFKDDQRSVSVNDEPLLINTIGSWANRPNATTEVPNLFLASDYVRTETDVACMEAANEAARRAVNGILDRDGRKDKVKLFPVLVPKQYEWEKKLDCGRYHAGKLPIGWDFPVPAAHHTLDDMNVAMNKFIQEWETAKRL
jgi:15-cis-phytoene desaturase